MTAMEFIAIIGFASLFLSAGITIGRLIERFIIFVHNKMTTQNSSPTKNGHFYMIS